MINAVLSAQFHKKIVDLSYLPKSQQDSEVNYTKKSGVNVLC